MIRKAQITSFFDILVDEYCFCFSAPLVNVNKRPISLDNVSSTVTDLVTHLLQKSGLATRAENTDNITNIDDDDDDDVCITRMEPARGLSAQRQQQRTQAIPAPTQRNTQVRRRV